MPCCSSVTSIGAVSSVSIGVVPASAACSGSAGVLAMGVLVLTHINQCKLKVHYFDISLQCLLT